MTYLVVLWLLCAAALLPSPVRAQSADTAAIPEMARLAKVLAGDWNTVEIVQHGQPVPKGAGRRGTAHVRLTGVGTVLVSEGHSVGTVGGDLRWFITIWWEASRTIYATNRGSPTSFKEPVTVDTGDTFLVDTNVALVAQPTRNALRAFSAITGGAWNSLVVPVDTGDTFLVDTNVALVAQPTQNQLRAYSAVTGTWVSLGVAVDAGDAFKVGGNTQ